MSRKPKSGKVKLDSGTYYKIFDAIERIQHVPDFLNEKMNDTEIRQAVIDHKLGITDTDIDGRFEISSKSKYSNVINEINHIDVSKRNGESIEKYVDGRVGALTKDMNGKQLRELGQELGFSNITMWKSREQRQKFVSWYVYDRFVTNNGNMPLRDKTLAQQSFRIDKTVNNVKSIFTHNQIGRERLINAVSGLSKKERNAYGEKLSEDMQKKYFEEIKKI